MPTKNQTIRQIIREAIERGKRNKDEPAVLPIAWYEIYDERKTMKVHYSGEFTQGKIACGGERWSTQDRVSCDMDGITCPVCKEIMLAKVEALKIDPNAMDTASTADTVADRMGSDESRDGYLKINLGADQEFTLTIPKAVAEEVMSHFSKVLNAEVAALKRELKEAWTLIDERNADLGRMNAKVASYKKLVDEMTVSVNLLKDMGGVDRVKARLEAGGMLWLLRGRMGSSLSCEEEKQIVAWLKSRGYKQTSPLNWTTPLGAEVTMFTAATMAARTVFEKG